MPGISTWWAWLWRRCLCCRYWMLKRQTKHWRRTDKTWRESSWCLSDLVFWDLAGASDCLHAWNPDIDGSFGAPADANVVCVQCSCGMWSSIAHWSTEPGKACNETGGNQDTKDPRSPRNKSEERLVRPWTAANHSKSKKRIQIVKGRDGGAKGLSNPEIWRCWLST